jgi:SAM-dependent methyltransferase
VLPEISNADEIAYWNGAGGQSWINRQAIWDQVLSPVADAVIQAARPLPGEQVIDIGCGCGATSIALARIVGPGGHVLGLDVSAPMLAHARQRAGNDLKLDFVRADATTYALPQGQADLLFSRFGVMFFSDPVLAFGNLRRGLRAGGRLAFSCFRAAGENPWVMVPLKAAYQHVPPLPRPGPEDPGPFSFADAGRVEQILTGAGFAEIKLTPVDLAFDLAAGNGLEEAVRSVLEIGPTSRAIQDQPADKCAGVTAAVRDVLRPHQQGNQVPLPAAIWLVTASNR